MITSKLTGESDRIDKKIKLEEGEMICDKCNGTGMLDKLWNNGSVIFKNICKKCQGTGKVDWIENVIGKKPSCNSGSMYSTSGYAYEASTSGIGIEGNNACHGVYGTGTIYDEIIKTAAENIAKKIDEEILESLKNGG